MVTLAVRSWWTGAATVVACRLANDADEPRVALLDSRLDGPTHVATAYRCEEATLRVTVPANGTVGAGFTTPAEPTTEPAAALVSERPPEGPHQDAVLAELSEPRPPHRAVVADGRPAETDGVPCGESSGSCATGTRRADANPPALERDVTAAMDAVERRIDRLEAVAAAATVPEAADALEREGGLDSVRRLDARVRADRDRLTALADRALTLAGRAEAAEPRIAVLDRLS